jgi:pyrroline-5-carboxylate reductase
MMSPPSLLKGTRLALIGVGVVGRILIQRLQAAGLRKDQLMVCDDDPARGARVQREFGLKVCPLTDACCRADIWLIATPPDAVLPTLQVLAPRLGEGHTVISFAAGVPMAHLEAALPETVAVARIMPSALARIGRGVHPVAYGRGCTLDVRAQVQEILNALGESIILEDGQMDWAVGLTGATMRWLVPVLEGMTQAGLEAGLSPDNARWVAAHMLAGVAAMALETDLDFEEMRSLTSLAVADEEAIAIIFREAARRAQARAAAMHAREEEASTAAATSTEEPPSPD